MVVINLFDYSFLNKAYLAVVPEFNGRAEKALESAINNNSQIAKAYNFYHQANELADKADEDNDIGKYTKAKSLYQKANSIMTKVLSNVDRMNEKQFYSEIVDKFGGKEAFRGKFSWITVNDAGKKIVCGSTKFTKVYNDKNSSVDYAMDIARLNNFTYKIRYYQNQMKYYTDPWLTTNEKKEALSKIDILSWNTALMYDATKFMKKK